MTKGKNQDVVVEDQTDHPQGKDNYALNPVADMNKNTTMVYPQVRAISHDQVLSLLDPLELPEGAEVCLNVQFNPSDLTNETRLARFVYPTRLVPAKKLDNLTSLVAVGGDALTDSEALYDANWP